MICVLVLQLYELFIKALVNHSLAVVAVTLVKLLFGDGPIPRASLFLGSLVFTHIGRLGPVLIAWVGELVVQSRPQLVFGSRSQRVAVDCYLAGVVVFLFVERALIVYLAIELSLQQTVLGVLFPRELVVHRVI